MSTEYLNNKTLESLIVKFQKNKIEKKIYETLFVDINETKKRTAKRGKYQQPDAWKETEEKYKQVLISYYETQDQLASAFYTLSENIVRYAKFNLIDQDDAIQDCVLVCFEKIDRFDTSKGKAFNFLTTISINSLRQLYRTSRNYNELKKKYLNHLQSKQNDQLPLTKTKNVFKKQKISIE